MLAQSSANSPDDFGKHIDEGDWIRIPGGAAFDQKYDHQRNYRNIRQAKQFCEEHDKLVFVHDRYSTKKDGTLRPGRIHIYTPDRTWRPEYAQLP